MYTYSMCSSRGQDLPPAILIMAEDRLKAVHQRAEKYRIPALVYRL